MEKNYYKAILLVLASDNSPIYKSFKSVYRAYLYKNPNIKVLFVYGNCSLFNQMDYDLVFNDIEENYYPGMITKTVRALEYINQHYTYDYLIRTNLSTFWDFDLLIHRLSRLPATNCLTGTLRTCVYGREQSPMYVAGVDLILSYDLVKELVKEQNKLCSLRLPEDWALSQFFIDRNLMPKPSCPGAIHHMDKFPQFSEQDVLTEISLAKQMNHDHFRLKNRNRDIDIKIAESLLKEYYGETVL